jgi:membrane protease YdiL (CAAX protease family)
VSTTGYHAPTLPPAAWYPDPSGVGELRYWNGTEWTPGVVIGGQVTERAMPWPPVRPTHAGYGYGAYGTYAPAPTVEPDERAELPGRAAWYGLAGFVAGLVAGLLLAFLATQLNLPEVVVLVLNVAALWTGLLGACWLVSRRYGSGNLSRDYGLTFRGKDFSWGLVSSLAARFAAAIVVIPFFFAGRRFLGTNQGVYGEVRDSVPGFVVFAVIAVIGAPLVEELFFRGLLMRSLSTAIGIGGALVAQAFLFGLAHFSPLLGLANLSVMTAITAAGLIFGITAWKRRVGTSVAAHAFFNLVAVLVAAAFA